MNRASVTAVAERLTTLGRAAGSGSRPARASPGTSTGSRRRRTTAHGSARSRASRCPRRSTDSAVTIGGTFVRYAGPPLWPWLLGAVRLRRARSCGGDGDRAAARWRSCSARSPGLRRSPSLVVVRRRRRAERPGRVAPDRARRRARRRRCAVALVRLRGVRRAHARAGCIGVRRRRGEPRLARRVPARRRDLAALGDRQPRAVRGRARRRARRPRRRFTGRVPAMIASPPAGLPVADRRRPALPPDRRERGGARRAGPSGRCGARTARRFAVHVELFARRQVVIVPPRDRRRPQRLHLSRCERRRRPASSTCARAGRFDARRPLPRLGHGGSVASRLLSFRGPRLRVRRRQAPRRRSAARSPDAARADRGRGRRLRRAASQLPVPERKPMIGARSARARRASSLLAGCGGSSKPSFPTIQRGTHLRARRLQAAGAGRRRQADDRLVRDPAAERQAADALPARPGPAHRRAPDHRAPRPRDDRAPAPADRRGRDDQRDGHVHRARAVPRRRRRVPEHDRPAAQLPAVRLAAGRRGVRAAALPPFAPTVVVDGYRFTLHGRPTLHAIQAGFLTDHRHRPEREARALHAVVRRARARDLLPARARSTTSTRTSARPARPAARACSAATKVTGSSSTPGQAERRRARSRAPGRGGCSSSASVDGHILTAPFTLTGQPEEGDTITVKRTLRSSSSLAALVGARRRERRVRARASQPAGRAREGELQLFTLAVPTEKDEAHDDEDRAHRACRVRHRLVRAVARLEAHGAADRLAARAP